MTGIYCTAASMLLLFSSFWNCLYCFDPLLSFVGCCSLEKVVSLIWGYDLKEVSFNLVFFGWARKKMKKKEIKGISWRETADSKQQLYFMVIACHSGEATWAMCILWQRSHSPSGTNSTAVTTDPRRWMEPRGSSPWHKERRGKEQERLSEKSFYSYFSLYKYSKDSIFTFEGS